MRARWLTGLNLIKWSIQVNTSAAGDSVEYPYGSFIPAHGCMSLVLAFAVLAVLWFSEGPFRAVPE